MSISSRLKLSRFFKGEGPENGTITLTQRRIYILPTRAGLSFALILFAMFLAAINYNNSLAYILSFLLASVSIVSILHCFANLQGLKIRSNTPQPVFLGEALKLPIHIYNSAEKQRSAIKYGWPKQPPAVLDLATKQGEWLQVATPTLQRGRQTMGRICLYTRYPLGLFHAWSYAQFPLSGLVYPKPIGTSQLPLNQDSDSGAEGEQGRGSDDFIGQRNYHLGDSPRQINWKALAAERGLLSKQFAGNQSQELTLNWQMVTTLDTEQKLSQLCLWVIQAEKKHLRYGLEIPGLKLPPNQGQLHYEKCLRGLALYGFDS